MIEMQYNFPLLPEQAAQWRERLAEQVAALSNTDFDELRPTFRSDQSELTGIGAQWMGTPPERTFLTEGGHHGSLIAMMAMDLAGHPIAIDLAGYTGAIEQARALGCTVLPCHVDAEGMVPESLHDRCKEAQREERPVRAVYLIPTVHNPLGCVASLARRHALIAVAREFDLLLIEDDAYGYMAPDAPPTLASLAPERTFYDRGLSKSYAPAARTGFLVAPEPFVPRMWTAIKNTATGTSLVHARAAVSLIKDGSLDRVIAAKNEEGIARNHEARAMLGGATCWPGAPAAWHLWLNLPAHVTPQQFEQRVADAGALISGGNWFATGPDAPNGCRLALGGEVDRDRCLEGVRIVAEVLQKL